MIKQILDYLERRRKEKEEQAEARRLETTFEDVAYCMYSFVCPKTQEEHNRFGVYFTQNLAGTRRSYRLENCKVYMGEYQEILHSTYLRHGGAVTSVNKWKINGFVPSICEVIKGVNISSPSKNTKSKSATILKLVHDKESDDV